MPSLLNPSIIPPSSSCAPFVATIETLETLLLGFLLAADSCFGKYDFEDEVEEEENWVGGGGTADDDDDGAEEEETILTFKFFPEELSANSTEYRDDEVKRVAVGALAVGRVGRDIPRSDLSCRTRSLT